MKIYIAGPYTPATTDSHDAPRLAHRNVVRAIRAGIQVFEKGHIPFIPHLTHFIHLEMKRHLPAEFYRSYDMVWLRYCDALLYLGHSRGAERELEYARKRNLKIFRAIEEIRPIRKANMRVVSRSAINKRDINSRATLS
jgi:hypothetical protein